MTFYPEAPAGDTVDQLHGHRVADPYRWLEDESSLQTRAWQDAQAALLARHREAWTERPRVAELLRRLTPGLVSLPTWRGGRAFFHRREPGQEHAVYWVREADGSERPLVDPARLDPALTTVLDGALPSHDGRRLAYLTSGGGREESSLWVLDVGDGQLLEGPILLGRGADVAWGAGPDELFCVRRLPDAELPPGQEQFHRRVWRHRIGTDPGSDQMLFGAGRDKTTYYGLHASPDGRWLVVSAALGTAPRNDLYLLETASSAWRTVQEDGDWETSGFVAFDGWLYLHTNREAPNWRLCRADPAEPWRWTEVLPEGPGVLTDVAVTARGVVAVTTHDVTSRVTVHPSEGAPVEIDLPGLGVADVAARPEGGEEVWIGYSDYTRPRLVLHHDLATGVTGNWASSPGAVPLAATTERFFVASGDGTRVPLFLTAEPARQPGAPRPTLLYGYGGFDVALPPAYSPLFAAWVSMGGVVAVANLRGGSEYGEDWHRAGMRGNKQNVFDDFLACAEWLIEQGWTDRRHLGIFGGSNGGLLVGAALTQRPELFEAVVCSAPLLDMVRYERFGLGQTWNDEYGSAEVPEELEWLLGYSPYHRVRPGIAYPAVLFTVFDGDTRVDPLHARKMCAALQAATSSDPERRPVLFRLEGNVGHGVRAVSFGIELQADELSFLARQLDLAHTA